MKWESAALTDRGKRRPQNEDAFLALPDRGIFAVADGMGGHAAGEVASQLAVETVDAALSEGYTRRFGVDRTLRLLGDAVRRANREILDVAGRDHDKAGMGTTLTALALVSRDGAAALAHVGDSRAYRFRGNQLVQLTEDHTWVQQQVVEGLLAPEQARRHPFANILTEALGTGPEVRVDTLSDEVRPGDLLLLCSDGLTSMIDDDVLTQILRAGSELGALARNLVDEANTRGGYDNITVVLVRILQD